MESNIHELPDLGGFIYKNSLSVYLKKWIRDFARTLLRPITISDEERSISICRWTEFQQSAVSLPLIDYKSEVSYLDHLIALDYFLSTPEERAAIESTDVKLFEIPRKLIK